MILTKEGYFTSIGLLLPDNSTQQISPADLRTSLVNLADSVNQFLVDETIVAKNIASISTRTTLLGDGAIASRNLVGRSNQDVYLPNLALWWGSCSPRKEFQI